MVWLNNLKPVHEPLHSRYSTKVICTHNILSNSTSKSFPPYQWNVPMHLKTTLAWPKFIFNHDTLLAPPVLVPFMHRSVVKIHV